MPAKTINGLKRNYKMKDKDSGKCARVRRLRCVLPFHTRLTEISLCHCPFTAAFLLMTVKMKDLRQDQMYFYDISVQTHLVFYLPSWYMETFACPLQEYVSHNKTKRRW